MREPPHHAFGLLESLQATPSLNLFPTENRMSPRALRALSSDAVHRYPTAEGPDFFYGDTLGLADMYEECASIYCRDCTRCTPWSARCVMRMTAFSS